jgi:F-type H+-transporting ATPase subunit delta
MSDYRVARRYAKSIFQLAVEKKVLEEVHDSMVLVHKTCAQNRNLVLLLRNPVVRYDYKLRVLTRIFKEKTDPLSLRFIELLTKKNRANILPRIAEVYTELYNEHKNITIARLTSAIPLSDEVRSSIIDRVKKGDQEVILQETIDEELIGGFILNIDDTRIDNSISSMLKNIERELTKEK